MEIKLREVSIRELVEGYVNNNEEGVVGFGGKLNIRPAYQREFIYKPNQQKAVIDTIEKGYPLNVLYWVVNDDGSYELLDGQQRTLSICEYVAGNYSKKHRFFHNLNNDEKNKILNYKLMIYICEGTDTAKLNWFKTINIAGEKLTRQELRNAIYVGEWLTDAKRYFSKTSCPAYILANEYIRGVPIRQEYLETAISWISDGDIEKYMSINQHNPNANELWLYFNKVINWVKILFGNHYRKEMKGVNFGKLFNEYGENSYNEKDIEIEVKALMSNDEVTKRSGIYYYIFDRNEKHLNIRTFTNNQKRKLYENQNGICNYCKEKFDINEMEADHITPWSRGGKTDIDNGQMLCVNCNRTKSDK